MGTIYDQAVIDIETSLADCQLENTPVISDSLILDTKMFLRYPIGYVLYTTNKDYNPADTYQRSAWIRISQGRGIIGYDGSKPLGSMGGSNKVTIENKHFPPHFHNIYKHYHKKGTQRVQGFVGAMCQGVSFGEDTSSYCFFNNSSMYSLGVSGLRVSPQPFSKHYSLLNIDRLYGFTNPTSHIGEYERIVEKTGNVEQLYSSCGNDTYDIEEDTYSVYTWKRIL